MSILMLLTKGAEEVTKAGGAPIPKVNLSQHTEESYYAIARVIMKCSRWTIDLFGMGQDENLFNFIYALLVFLIAIGVGMIVKWIIVYAVRLLGKRLSAEWYSDLLESRFFVKICRIVPPLVFVIFIQFTLTHRATLESWLTRLSWIYIVYIVALSLSTLSMVIWRHIDQRENKRRLPLHGLVQLVKGVIWIISVIIVLAILFNKSPGSLLAGLGAFAAVLMLIFKDSILGLVAGVQLSENDSLHVGDWIKVNGTDANGTVMEVSLTSVKVMNWDKTVTTLPPYSLVSGSFTNFRTMQESGTRRVQRVYMIDADSVVPTDDAMLDKFAEIPLLKDWIAKKRVQKSAGHVQDANNSDGLADGSIESNLGVFRAYMKLYLDAHPKVDHSGGIGFCFVTTLPQTTNGIPLQLYFFTATSAWLEFEAIQASIFEHLAVMMYRFNLYTYEAPSGRDTILDGYISPGKNPDVLFGLPYPFYNASGTPSDPAYPPQKSASPQPTAMQTPDPAAVHAQPPAAGKPTQS